MKKTISHLIIAVPLATVALTLVPGAATASSPSDSNPVIVVAPKGGDPEPKGPGNIAPKPKPQAPKGPGNIAPKPKPQAPKGPGDLAPAPKPTKPKGPGDITNPAPCPTHGKDCSPGDKGDKGGNGGGNGGGGNSGTNSSSTDKIAVPTRIDAGLAADEQGGAELTWLLAGGALVTASGAAFAINRKRRTA